MNLTTINITFLKHIPSNIKVDKTSSWRHHYFDGLNLGELYNFINQIGDDRIYLLIPLFTSSESLSMPTLNLSEPFLVDNQSNVELIIKFIIAQWKSSGFEIKQGTSISLCFKFKRVWFSDK